MTTPPSPPSSPWRPPRALERYCFRAEAFAYEHYGQDNRFVRQGANRVREVKLLHNRAGLWHLVRLAIEDDLTANGMHTLVQACSLAFRDLDVGFEHASTELRSYETGRQRPVGMRAEDYQDLKGPDGRRLRPSDKPVTDIRGLRIQLKKAYKLWKAAGRPVTVTIGVPKKRRTLATNAITWYSTEYLASGKRGHYPGDAGFEHAHYIGIDLPDIRGTRCSNIKRIKGRPAWVKGSRIAWLGPHYKPIEAARNQRLAQEEKGSDPVIWLDAEGNPLNTGTHKKRLRRAMGLKKVQPSKVVETGKASLAARGATPEYLGQCAGVECKDSVNRLEDFVERVLNAVAEGIDLGIASPQHGGSAPGIITCEVCSYEQEIGATVCVNPSCRAPLGTEVTDRLERRRAELHRLIDDILSIRDESDDDRERLDDNPPTGGDE